MVKSALCSHFRHWARELQHTEAQRPIFVPCGARKWAKNRRFAPFWHFCSHFLEIEGQGEGVMFAKKDFDNGRRQFEVHLNNGVQLEFDKKGNWDKVDCQFNAVPAHLVPTVIANYVQTSYPGATIVKIDKERYGFKIELSNDLEMKFNKQGALFDIDD